MGSTRFTWRGTEIDIDVLNFTMVEWELIEQRTGLPGMHELMAAAKQLRPVPFRAIFWVAMRRQQPDLSYSDFDGPTYGEILSEEIQNAIGSIGEGLEVAIEGKAPVRVGSARSRTGSVSTRKRSTGSRSKTS